MGFRLVPKSVTLNDLERRLLCVISPNLVNLRSNITAFVRIELIDQKSASITHRAGRFACVTKCKISALLTFNLWFKSRFTVLLFVLMLDFPLR